MQNKVVRIGLAVLLVGLAAALMWWALGEAPVAVPDAPKRSERPAAVRPATNLVEAVAAAAPPEPAEEEEEDAAAVDPEAAAVDAFDNLTDQWLEPRPEGVSLADMDKFAEAFRQVPEARKDECIHRALNLIPDANVMLLAAILLDKSQSAETAGTIFSDVLNRDESVKLPVLKEIFKDKSHPCWEDTAWILDVTGELGTAAPKHETK